MRLIGAAVLLCAAIGLAVGAVLVIGYRGRRENAVRRDGVGVVGRVVGQTSTALKSGEVWYDDVQWTVSGRFYDDDDTLRAGRRDRLLPVGASVPVLADRDDPSFAAIDGVFTGGAQYSVALGVLLIAPALVAGLLGALLSRSWLRLRTITRRRPWQAATIGSVERVTRRNGRTKYTLAEIIGDGPRLRIQARNVPGKTGEPVWVALDGDAAVVARPGAFELRYTSVALADRG